MKTKDKIQVKVAVTAKKFTLYIKYLTPIIIIILNRDSGLLTICRPFDIYASS